MFCQLFFVPFSTLLSVPFHVTFCFVLCFTSCPSVHSFQVLFRILLYSHSRSHSPFRSSYPAGPWHENRKALIDWLFENKEILNGSQNAREDCSRENMNQLWPVVLKMEDLGENSHNSPYYLTQYTTQHLSLLQRNEKIRSIFSGKAAKSRVRNWVWRCFIFTNKTGANHIPKGEEY